MASAVNGSDHDRSVRHARYLYNHAFVLSVDVLVERHRCQRRRSDIQFPGQSNWTPSRHRCDVSLKLCRLGAKPRRWSIGPTTRYTLQRNIGSMMRIIFVFFS